ncbi:MAG TPA: KTSC domain-containing protein [Polyangiaceae bacterium]
MDSVGYHAERFVLRVLFKSGAAYDYAGVPPEVKDALLGAESIGTYLAKHIKGRFPTTKIELAPATATPASEAKPAA